jgi:hypothetical protein
MVAQKPRIQGPDTDIACKDTVFDQIRIKPIPHPYIVPGRTAIALGFKDPDFFGSYGTILILPARPMQGAAGRWIQAF